MKPATDLCHSCHVGLSETVELSFMLVGHTKFAPYRLFGLSKHTSLVGTMTDIVRVVKESSPSGKNKTVTSSGSREVHWIDWLQHFFKPIPTSRCPEQNLTVKMYANSPEEKIGIFKKILSLRGQKPNKIVPTGLDAKRQWYLYDEIRPLSLDYIVATQQHHVSNCAYRTFYKHKVDDH